MEQQKWVKERNIKWDEILNFKNVCFYCFYIYFQTKISQLNCCYIQTHIKWEEKPSSKSIAVECRIIERKQINK